MGCPPFAAIPAGDSDRASLVIASQAARMSQGENRPKPR